MFEDGQVVGGHYKLISRLGVGGMGSVFHAVDTHLNREVALKFLDDDLLEIDEYRRRFIHEGRILASLRHPNIVEVYSLEIEANTNTHFLIMEFAQGKPLSKFLVAGEKKAPLLSCLLQTVNGIDACHKKGIIHRDIKPDNIIISENGQAKIVDFGLAKTDVKITVSGAAMGTATYMSPEQCMGTSNLTPQSDVYALGILLWELLLGKPPFTPAKEIEDPYMAVSVMHMNDAPPLELLQKDSFTGYFAGILGKMLLKDPEGRPEMTEIASFLEQAINKARETDDPPENSPPNLEMRILLGSFPRGRR